VGRTTQFRGKRLFDILARLKRFGAGRIVYRNGDMQKFGPTEPCYYVITKVEPDMSDPTEAEIDLPPEGKSIAYGMRVWRGEPRGEHRIVRCHENDWRLVHRLDEQKFLSYQIPDIPFRVVPDEVPLPPLLEHLVLQDRRLNAKRRQGEEKSGDTEGDMGRTNSAAGRRRPVLKIDMDEEDHTCFENETKLSF